MSKEEVVTVLVIDHDLADQERLGSYLVGQNYKVVLAGSGEEGIDCFHSFCPDLVLFDLDLPDMDALQALQSILRQSPEQPIILLAGRGKAQVVTGAMKLGVSDYLVKPVVDLEMLGISIENTLRRARLITENTNYRKRLELINRELEERVEIFRQDQQAGRHVQMSILPESPQEICGYVFGHCIIPSLYLSGDSVDYKPIAKHKVLFYLADVSGHGSSSAFITVLLRFRIEQMRREFIRGRFAEPFDPARILELLNKDLHDSGLDKYITIFMGVLDHLSQTLNYSVAGHYPLPVLYDADGARFLPVTAPSFPIGLSEDASYPQEQLRLQAPFSLLLFSDGILETADMRGVEDREAYLLRAVTATQGDFDRLVARLNLENLSNVPDDITVMSIASP